MSVWNFLRLYALFGKDNLVDRPWTGVDPPSRILVIRFHATGDVALTLSACLMLRRRFPNSLIDYLTVNLNAGLPKALKAVDSVRILPDVFRPEAGKAETFLRRAWFRMAVPIKALVLTSHRYDLVIDLQNNPASRRVVRIIKPTACSFFDRFSPVSAESRILGTLERAGLHGCQLSYARELRQPWPELARNLLVASGWSGRPLVVLNPAGLWPSRNWPLDRYAETARYILARQDVEFVILGTDRIRSASEFLIGRIGSKVIRLDNKTSLSLAMGVLGLASVVLSEDSGLAAMALTIGIPTVILLGSTRHDWTTPTAPHTICLHSGDMECGSCMAPLCRYGDVPCLTRYSSELVANHVLNFLTLADEGEIPGKA